MGLFKRIAGWFRPQPGQSPFTLLVGTEGEKMLADPAMMAYVNSTAPQPTQAALDSLLDQVYAVRVFNDGCDAETLLGNQVLLEVSEPDDLASLRMTLRIIDGPGGHCMCFGGPTLEMLSAERIRLALVGIHHGLSIRWNQWKDDALLEDGRLLLVWLAQRGVAGPLQEYEEREAHQRQGMQDWDRWLAAMPGALAPVWSTVRGGFGRYDLTPLLAALQRDMPSERERILALLAWYGSGAGPWSGFPA
ncbi:MAG TPA: hypothetical protein VJ809_00715 [Pirellulales bacterium]|nr:hypothetical protein [Pirellulales bacterium]